MHRHYSADYKVIEHALMTRAKSFVALGKEMAEFKPRPIETYDKDREAWIRHMQNANQSMPPDQISKFADDQIRLASSERMQFLKSFSDRFMAEEVSITLLAHALCEAVINAVLALGLSESGRHATFSLIEKADVKEKWTVAPKLLHKGYDLPKGHHLYGRLNSLCKRRNAFVHHKITLHVDNQKVLDGSEIGRRSFVDAGRWVRQIVMLPYDLHSYLCGQLAKDGALQSTIIFLLNHQTHAVVEGNPWSSAAFILAQDDESQSS
jgi:hypothetical protein